MSARRLTVSELMALAVEASAPLEVAVDLCGEAELVAVEEEGDRRRVWFHIPLGCGHHGRASLLVSPEVADELLGDLDEDEELRDHDEPGEQAALVASRAIRLMNLGFESSRALELAEDPEVDVHAIEALVRTGCPPDLAATIAT